jgi:hypothetical protein
MRIVLLLSFFLPLLSFADDTKTWKYTHSDGKEATITFVQYGRTKHWARELNWKTSTETRKAETVEGSPDDQLEGFFHTNPNETGRSDLQLTLLFGERFKEMVTDLGTDQAAKAFTSAPKSCPPEAVGFLIESNDVKNENNGYCLLPS